MRILITLLFAALAFGEPARQHIRIRGIYGGVPTMLMEKGRTLKEAGVNAVWIGERGITAKRIKLLKAQGAKIFAEFNTLHRADYLKQHPDAAPVGKDGKRLSVTLEFYPQGGERIWLQVKDDYEAAGVEFNLKLVDGATLIKKRMRQFCTISGNWSRQ